MDEEPLFFFLPFSFYSFIHHLKSFLK